MSVREAAARAAAFLTSRQSPDGVWRDYDAAPVGASDAWVTVYVGRAMAACAASGVSPAAAEAAQRAAGWLHRERAFPQGWGFNATSGPDADSTGHAIALLRATGTPVADADLAWLRRRWRPNGGCATYDRRDAWGVAHVDVTPIAYLALPGEMRAEVRDSTRAFIGVCREPDGTWPAYWWRGCHYSTYWNLRALAADADANGDGPVASHVMPETLSDHPTREIRSAFDLAFAVGSAYRAGRRVEVSLDRLLQSQSPDGSWPGGPNLRVTSPWCFRPWETPSGALYVDERHLLTTASVLLVLADLASSTPSADV